MSEALLIYISCLDKHKNADMNRKKYELKNAAVISRAKRHPKDRDKVSKNFNLSKTKETYIHKFDHAIYLMKFSTNTKKTPKP